MLRHLYKTLAFACSVALAGICGSFAIIVAFTLVDAITVNIGLAIGLYGCYRGGKK
jgi:hypothetical protein